MENIIKRTHAYIFIIAVWGLLVGFAFDNITVQLVGAVAWVFWLIALSYLRYRRAMKKLGAELLALFLRQC